MPVAVNCVVAPVASEELAGVTTTDFKLVSTPVPVMVTVCGLPTAESEIVRVPGIEPASSGVKTMVAVQLEEAAKVLVQVVVVTA